MKALQGEGQWGHPPVVEVRLVEVEKQSGPVVARTGGAVFRARQYEGME